MGQGEVVSQIGTNLYIGYLTNLFTHSGQNRGFTYTSSTGIPRVPSMQHDPARDYIYARFAAFGLSPGLDPFSFYTYFKKSGPTNLYQHCKTLLQLK